MLGGAPELHQPAVRAFIETAINTRYPDLTATDVLVLKDQNASAGCDEISAALPESRFIALIRDPRDVMASMIDAVEKPTSWAWDERLAAWIGEVRNPEFAGTFYSSIATLLDFTLTVHEAHRGPKSIVRYEDLRADTASALRRLLGDLDLHPDQPSIDEVCHRHAFERIPVSETGSGKFFRTANPGGWRETLPDGFREAVSAPLPPLLSQFYSVG